MLILSKIKEKVRRLPNKPGVYLMRDRFGQIIYVGKAKNLKKRVSNYFRDGKGGKFIEDQPKIAAMIPLVHDIEVIEVKSDIEALILESQLIKQWKPRYNTSAKDDKQFLMVKVDVESTIPQFRLTRNRTDTKSIYFGPFVNSLELKNTLKELRLEYGILLGDAHPKKIEQDKYHLYDDVRAEIYGHPNEVTEAAYRQRVEKACSVMEGKVKDYVVKIEKQMAKASQKKEYEKAARFRDILFALKKTLSPSRKFSHGFEKSIPQNKPLELLGKVLGLDQPPHHIECFDISHISGTFVVASMVHFTNGLPDKAKYRRYKIRTFIGNDDYRAMQEVVSRRYSKIVEEKNLMPDLIVVDGGKGQVNAAISAFLALEINAPMIIGLAKKRETIVFPDERGSLNLPSNSPPLQLLQRLRDEAHRFANAFNAELRRKKIRESILDEFYGLGPVRKQSLLAKFKSISNLKKASIRELQEIPGIGEKLALELYDFLKKH